MIELSVVVATFNRKAMIRRCLQALERQTQAPDDFEVVVVVDGSTDGTAEALAGLQTPYRLTIITQPNAGQGAALNRGVAAAAGRYCLFIDDDITPGPALVATHLAAQREGQGIIGVGRITLQLPPHPDRYTQHFAAWWAEHYDQLGRGARDATYMDCYTGNLSVPRASFLDVGGFATDLVRSHDVEIGYHLSEIGLPVTYLPDAVAGQDYRKGATEIALDTERAGMASVELYRRHPPMIARLRLGRFGEASLRELVLRRLALYFDVPVRPLALLGAVFSPTNARLWYQFVDRYAYWRGVQQAVRDRDTWHRLTRGPVVLMYHAVAGPGEPASRYVIPVHRFARQMSWLRRAGYRVLPLDEVVNCLREHRLPPARSVVITADDGYTEQRTLGSILRRYQLPATFFLVSRAVGARNTWDRGGALEERPLMEWDEARDLRRCGVAFGSHTADHRDVTTLAPETLEADLAQSREDLARELGAPVELLAYPYGRHDPRSEAAVQRAGFRGACTVRPGTNDLGTSPTALRRTEVYGSDSPLTFALAVWFGKTKKR
jgi:glycosyltransferase involved in cell wall biosynthesis/peptidoglycan/xylan/chitin deacetylase (PgdA/CDA1 family)